MTDHSNSSNDGAFVQSSYSSKQENCLKSIQTLEVNFSLKIGLVFQ